MTSCSCTDSKRTEYKYMLNFVSHILCYSVELEGLCRSPIERLIGVGSISLLHERLVSKRNSNDALVEKLNMKVSLKQGDKDQV